MLKVTHYSEWLANMLSIPKKDTKVRMCIDYRDLNKISPKDDFPLPHIDVFADKTTEHTLFSFMDDFAVCNQIRLALED